MTIHLREHGTSFATRERARDIASDLLSRKLSSVTLDLSGVMCSPSFLAELMVTLAAHAKTVSLVDCDRDMASKATRLIQQLGLAGQISVEENTIPA